MKKIAILCVFICLIIFQAIYQKNNVVYEAAVNKNTGEINIKSDFKDKVEIIKENKNSIYFDLKNAILAENFKAEYKEDLSVVSQQIGNKVRIYIKGDNLENFKTNFISDKNLKPVWQNWLLVLILASGYIVILARKSYSATIELKRKSIKYPMKTAMNLNKRLYEQGKRKSPEIVLNSTIPINSDVVDFQYAKDRKNIKIAI